MRRTDRAPLPSSPNAAGWPLPKVAAHPFPGVGASRLTRRERDVLALLAARWTDREIAAALFISRRTVADHVSSILAKLEAANRRDAAAIAIRYELI